MLYWLIEAHVVVVTEDQAMIFNKLSHTIKIMCTIDPIKKDTSSLVRVCITWRIDWIAIRYLFAIVILLQYYAIVTTAQSPDNSHPFRLHYYYYYWHHLRDMFMLLLFSRQIICLYRLLVRFATWHFTLIVNIITLLHYMGRVESIIGVWLSRCRIRLLLCWNLVTDWSRNLIFVKS